MTALVLMLLSAAVSASAQQTDPYAPTPKKTEPGFYRMAGRSWHEGDVVNRKSISPSGDLDVSSRFMYCMIPPAADFVLDQPEEHLEENYIHLLGSVLAMDGMALHDKDEGTATDDGKLSDNPAERFVEPNSGVVGLCGSLRSPTPRVSLARIDSMWRRICRNDMKAKVAGRFQCDRIAQAGGRESLNIFSPRKPIVETLRAIAKSQHVKAAKGALAEMEEIKGRDKLFAKTVSEVLLDEKTPLAVREKAAQTLASVHTHDLSAETLATVWGDKKNPESLRRAAFQAYSLILSFGDPRMTGNQNLYQCSAKGNICERLRKYLVPLIAIIKEETIEDKNGKDKLTPLGEDAYCVAGQYSRRWIWYARRKGANWYEELRKDEAKGLDESQPDGKLKTN